MLTSVAAALSGSCRRSLGYLAVRMGYFYRGRFMALSHAVQLVQLELALMAFRRRERSRADPAKTFFQPRHHPRWPMSWRADLVHALHTMRSGHGFGDLVEPTKEL